MKADPISNPQQRNLGHHSAAVHAIPIWTVWNSVIGLTASAVILLLFVSGQLSTGVAGNLLAATLSLAVMSSAAGNLLALARREVASETLARSWARVSARSAVVYLIISTVLLGVGTYVSFGHTTPGVDATIGTGMSFLYISQITSVCTLNRTMVKVVLGFQVAISYSLAVIWHNHDSSSILGIAVHLSIFGVTGLVFTLLAASIHDEMAKKSEFAEYMATKANLWSEIARKAHQIAETVDPSEIQRAVVEATVALGYEVSAISLLDKEHGTFRYSNPSPAVPEDLLNKDMPLLGTSAVVLNSKNTQIIDYIKFNEAVPSIKALGLRTTVGIPMWSAGEIIAVLIAGSLTERDIFAEELTALELLAAAGSLAQEHRHLTTSLVSQLSQFNAMIEDSPNPTIVLDENETVILASKRTDLLLGFEKRNLVGMHVQDILVDPDPVYELLRSEDTTSTQVQYQSLAICSDNSRLEVEVIASKGHSQSDKHLVTVSLRDITKQKQLEARLADNANFDPLTGLANRTNLLDEIRKAVVRNSRTKVPVALIVFELDHYRFVSDLRGEPDKEKTMMTVIKELNSEIKKADLFSRIGEDRFAVLAEDLSEPRTLSYVQQLLDRASETFYLDGIAVQVDATFGVAFAVPKISAETLLQRANNALLGGLTSDGSKITFFDPGQKRSAQRHLQLEDDINRALRNQQFHLEYQPIVDLRTNRVESAEALLRWNHPERGPIPPNDFIPVAEETGMIIPVGTWVVRQASRQLAEWVTTGKVGNNFTMHLNVSRVQLQSDQIVRDVAVALDDFALGSRRLSIEITETAFLNDSNAGNQIIHKLSELGILLAIDDFGTGYSSLSMLTNLPIDILKIDKSFVDQLGTKSEFTIEAIINMANHLNLTLVAEGIELQDQADKLLAMGCHFGQGFNFSSAVSAEWFPNLLTASPPPPKRTRGH